ncbi:flagellar basal body protein [Legionella dresdenensis]|uniref:Flagellar basal body rod protein FlgB n=1 Tax=Legionella dresdenensis TaxID=450200 RepID=A0ABV8CHI0_9GAMM
MTISPTTELISLALDAAIMRQTAIANNIANANTQGYQTIEVNFEQQLAQLDDKTLMSATPFYQLSPNQTSIDQQMALNIKNATQFRVLLKGLNHQLAIMKLAVQGNQA